jgi:hypothetical protein
MDAALPKATVLMPQNVKVDTIPMKEWPGMPQLHGLKPEPCFGEWSLAKMMDAFAMDRKIHAAGWNFFFMATEVNTMFLGFLGEEEVQSALKWILAKVKLQNFNGLKVTDITARRFLRDRFRAFSTHATELQPRQLRSAADVPARCGMGQRVSAANEAGGSVYGR